MLIILLVHKNRFPLSVEVFHIEESGGSPSLTFAIFDETLVNERKNEIGNLLLIVMSIEMSSFAVIFGNRN